LNVASAVLKQKYAAEIEAILAKYPEGRSRSAVMPLLFLAQRENGHITREAIAEVGDLLQLTTTEVGALIGFYTLFTGRVAATGSDLRTFPAPCAAERFAETCARTWGSAWGNQP
jgi:NADH-quinone oxidoreductase subunit E